MPKVTAKITNKLGMHARPAMAFAELASTFESNVTIGRKDNGEMVDGKSIMQILMLAGTCGTVLIINAEGTDAPEALAALKKLIKAGFDDEA